MLLGKPEIERYLKSGDITIDPFVPENLGSAQYDVTLGDQFYRERKLQGSTRPPVYNPFSESQVRSKWELNRAITHEDYYERTGLWLENIGHDEKLILIEPGEIILGHTEEFIGGSCNFITTMMKARSSLGRNGVEVCRCAGMGDVGYFTRWTMEIVNTSRFQTITLPVRRRVAQLLFFKVEPVAAKDVYDQAGKYQSSKSLAALKAAWTPEQMLPKQWKDRECRREPAASSDPMLDVTTASVSIYEQVKRSIKWLFDCWAPRENAIYGRPDNYISMSREQRLAYAVEHMPHASREMIEHAYDEYMTEKRELVLK